MNKSLLIVGKPNSTKTTFLIQLYSKIVSGKTNLTLSGPAVDISAITDGRKRLANGMEVQSTKPEYNTELIIPVLLDDNVVNLHFPDYGGEQINNIIGTRVVDEKWTNSIKGSDNWLLFVRLNNLETLPDLSNKTASVDQLKSKPDTERQYTVSSQSSYIELLQILLAVKEVDIHLPGNNLKLSIALTCWDELKTTESPKAVLAKHLPLLYEFIESNWADSCYKIMGLSAQGFSLDDENNQKLYKTHGSENYGFVIDENGEEKEDLGLLISESIA